jgi:Ca2+/Na+ antiporter
MKTKLRILAAASLALLFASPLAAIAGSGDLLVKRGEKIAFLGDSITANGASKDGYVTLVIDALNKEDLGVTAIPAGKSGNRSPDRSFDLRTYPKTSFMRRRAHVRLIKP